MSAVNEVLNSEIFKRWRDNLLILVGNTCRECDDPRREKEILNLNNPLYCSCRCQRIEEPLALAVEIDKDIKK